MEDMPIITPDTLDPATATWPEILAAHRELHDRTVRMVLSACDLWRAVTDADPALIPEDVAQAAAAFRAVVEENV